MMSDVLEDHEGTVSIGGRTITNLRFNDDIGGLAGTKTEPKTLVKHLDSTSKAFGMETSADKAKVMANNNTEGPHKWNDSERTNTETVSKFRYLETTVIDEGSRPEILSYITQAVAAFAKLKPV